MKKVKYKRQYIGEKVETISKEDAIRSVDEYYKDPEGTLHWSSKDNPVKTMFALYWVEFPRRA